MSAFIVMPGHIDYLISAAIAVNIGYPSVRFGAADQHVDLGNASDAGRMLWRENVASVSHRYPNSAPDDLPGPIPTPDPDAYEYRQYRTLTHVQTFKAIACYEYQSCERPGWDTSDAKQFCDQLRRAVIAILPGYEDAEWEIDERGGSPFVMGPTFD